MFARTCLVSFDSIGVDLMTWVDLHGSFDIRRLPIITTVSSLPM